MLNWETVATSMLTSGGILFAAYKIWFQRRLEDHKFSLQNNGKLFELELKALEEFGGITQEILRGDLGVATPLSAQEIFIIKAYENEKVLNTFVKKSSHIVSSEIITKFDSLIENYKKLQSQTKDYRSHNTGYGGGRYNAYNNLPQELLDIAESYRIETQNVYESFKADVFKRAGR
ncbi:hypothetical protein [Acinetobacter sp. WCHA45]|uniref:hypothetical protein n=1 Tax=Acinetobacter sp. WCHA45 TaxID=2004644 RepID=UPI000B3BF624|nr:hypothetical protein [Acinetobacter sp. WCHA45]AVZ86526.1 hypothetical protein CDG55_12740 [Acinetobacter sp. WCHA45]